MDEHLNSYNSPFKFNAKELDPETGNYYYGARYYDPKSSLWLSIDPLAEKYPNFSPYAYTFQNPLNFVDHTGMEGEPLKNIIINFNSNETFDETKFAESGWKVLNATDHEDAVNKLKNYLGDTKADNIYINAHGGESEYLLKNDFGEKIINPDYDPNDIESKKYLYGLTYSIKLGENNSDFVRSNSIEDYFSEQRRTLVSDSNKSSIESLISISNFINKGGNLILGSCNTGRDDKIGKYLVGLSSTENLNVFAFHGLVGISTNEANVVSVPHFFGREIAINGKAAKYTTTGIVYFKNIIINKNGTVTTK